MLTHCLIDALLTIKINKQESENYLPNHFGVRSVENATFREVCWDTMTISNAKWKQNVKTETHGWQHEREKTIQRKKEVKRCWIIKSVNEWDELMYSINKRCQCFLRFVVVVIRLRFVRRFRYNNKFITISVIKSINEYAWGKRSDKSTSTSMEWFFRHHRIGFIFVVVYFTLDYCPRDHFLCMLALNSLCMIFHRCRCVLTGHSLWRRYLFVLKCSFYSIVPSVSVDHSSWFLFQFFLWSKCVCVCVRCYFMSKTYYFR